VNVHIGWVALILIIVAAFYIYRHKPMTTQ
jgi:hypothetical protein